MILAKIGRAALTLLALAIGGFVFGLMLAGGFSTGFCIAIWMYS